MRQRSKQPRFVALTLERLEDRMCPTAVTGTPVAIPLNNQIGDVVGLVVTLKTSDANENGEREPIILNSSGGEFGFVGGLYNIPVPASFVAASANETLTAYIRGFDGDEVGDVSVTVNGQHILTSPEKLALNQKAANLNIAAAGLATAAALATAAPEPVVSKFGAAGLGVLAGLSWLGSAIYSKMALDPADSNYTVIAQPNPPNYPPFTAQYGASQQVVHALNAYLTNGEQIIGVGNALVTSLNRASGALQAGNGYWQAQQTQAASRYAQQLASLDKAQPYLTQALVTAWDANGLPELNVSPGQVLDFERQTLSAGLPSFLQQTLTQLGADSATISDIQSVAAVQDVNQVAGSYPSRLTDPTLFGVQDVVGALQAFGPVQRGQAAGIGFWNSSNGQALIKSFPGSVANWLASNFPNLYGASAGSHDLTGITNNQVAAFYQTLFNLRGQKLDAQVLATALNVYATTSSLGGTAASQYGFHVTPYGLASRFYNVGFSGSAFDVPNGTDVSVLDLLRTANRKAVAGVLFNRVQDLDEQANKTFGGINATGGI